MAKIRGSLNITKGLRLQNPGNSTPGAGLAALSDTQGNVRWGHLAILPLDLGFIYPDAGTPARHLGKVYYSIVANASGADFEDDQIWTDLTGDPSTVLTQAQIDALDYSSNPSAGNAYATLSDIQNLSLKGTDTITNILSKSAVVSNHLWISSTTGVDSLGNVVAIGDGLVSTGTGWQNIGPLRAPIELSDTGVIPGPYGTATSVGSFIVGSGGRLLTAEDVLISIESAQINDVINDGTFATASATLLASSSSIKVYVDSKLGGMSYRGNYDASVAPPIGVAILKGSTYTVTVTGNGNGFFAKELQVDDAIIAKVDDPITDTDWLKLNKNIPDIVNASETVEGLSEEATQTEANAGTAIGETGARLFINPAKLSGVAGTNAPVSPSVLNTITNTRIYKELVGDGVATTIAVIHELDVIGVTAQIFRNSAPYDLVDCEVRNTSPTTTTFIFNTAPTTDKYMAVITG